MSKNAKRKIHFSGIKVKIITITELKLKMKKKNNCLCIFHSIIIQYGKQHYSSVKSAFIQITMVAESRT